MEDMNNTSSTIQYYNDNAELFRKETITADMHAMQDWFLSFVKEKGHILDLGCGTGRDSKYFLEKGYEVTAVDGSREMCKIAADNTGLEVKQLLFEDIDYLDSFDAVWACASLLHVPYGNLPAILKRISLSIKDDGIFYLSFKKGTFEGDRNGRFYTDLTKEKLEKLLEQTGMISIKAYKESFDVRPDRKDEVWINIIGRKCCKCENVSHQ